MEDQSPPVFSSFRDVESHRRLVARLRRWPDRSWAVTYFRVMHYLLVQLELQERDPRLVTTIPKSAGAWSLPLTLNNRYVLAAHRRKKTCSLIFIYGPEYASLPKLQALTRRAFHFESLFGNVLEEPPFLLGLDSPEALLKLEPRYQAGWLAAARLELRRAKSSPYRKFHEPLVFQAAMNPEYQRQLLDEAFGD